MKTGINTLTAAIAVVALTAASALAAEATNRGKIVSYDENGNAMCYEADVKEAAAEIKKIEKLVDAGKLKQAFDAATGSGIVCEPEDADERIVTVIMRTYKKLGQQAEKAGRLYEAHKYYLYPRKHFDYYSRRDWYRDSMKNYSLTDAHRTMLAYGKANPNDFKIVEEVIRYFNVFLSDKPPQMKEANALAMRGGDKLLAKEAKSFEARKYKAAFKDIHEADRLYRLANDERSVYARAKMRVDSLLKDSAYDSIAQAFQYCESTLLGETYILSRDAGRARAVKLGDAAERKGDLELARKFYYLAEDETKKKSVDNRLTAIHEQQDKKEEVREKRRAQAIMKYEKAEPKRQEKFKKEQDSLEKELGL